MTYKITEEGNTATIFLNGEIDMDIADKAKEAILPLVDSGKEVHILEPKTVTRMGYTTVMKIKPNGDLALIAIIKDSKREDYQIQPTFKKLKE